MFALNSLYKLLVVWFAMYIHSSAEESTNVY